jgi:outer membrane protein assembly factor BamB
MPTPRRATSILTITAVAILVITAQPASAAAGDQLWTHTDHSNAVSDVEATSQHVASTSSGSGSGDSVQVYTRDGSKAWSHNRLGTYVNGLGTGGGYIAAMGNSGEVDIAQEGDGTQVTSYNHHSDVGNDVAVDNEIAVSGGDDNAVIAADPATGNKRWESSEPAASVTGVALNSDLAFSGDETNKLAALDRRDGATAWTKTGIGYTPEDIAVDGDRLAVAGKDNNQNSYIQVYNAYTGELVWEITNEPARVNGIDYDGRSVVAGWNNNTVSVYDPKTGRERFNHGNHNDTVTGVGVEGAVIGSGDNDGVVIAAENGPSLQNPSPQDGQYFDEIDLEVDVADTRGDTYTVSFMNATDGNNSAIDTVQVSSDTTASTTWQIDGDQPVTWYARIDDANGNERDRTREFDLNIPQTLYIRNETQPSQLVTDNTEIEVRFFGEDGQIIERTTTDGTIDMSGLPRDQPFAVAAKPGGDYLSRTIYIQTIFQQQSIYLLNGSAYNSVEVRFELDDTTGDYDSESFLVVQKPIKRSGTTAWRTVVGDKFGVEGVTEDLHQGRRYRIKVRNQQGDSQIVGPYRADVTETVQVRPGAPEIPLDNYSETWSYGAEADEQKITYQYEDPTVETEQVTVYIHERGNESNQLQPNQTFYDVGSASGTASFTGSQNESEWVVVFDVDREGGESHVVRTVVGANPDLTLPGLDQEWRLIAAVLMLFVTAGAFSVLNSAIGGVIIALQGGILWWTGWLEGATSAVLIVFALFISVLAHLYAKSGP